MADNKSRRFSELESHQAASSTYASGGGGYQFEYRVATRYLSLLLRRASAPEFGSAMPVQRVAFQQAPTYPVDDLVLRAGSSTGQTPQVELSVAVRRRIVFSSRNQKTRELIGKLTEATYADENPEIATRVAIAVSVHTNPIKNLARLCDLARDHQDAAEFFRNVEVPGRWSAALRKVLQSLREMVETGLQQVCDDATDTRVRTSTWRLLSRLHILMLRLEPPDQADWSLLAESLVPLTRKKDPVAAEALRDQLYALSSAYDASGAVVDTSTVRRALHEHLDSATLRNRNGWTVLCQQQRALRVAVRHRIGIEEENSYHFARQDAVSSLRDALGGANACVVVHGVSGVGKSSLVVRVLDQLAGSDAVDWIGFSLRDLPSSAAELVRMWDVPLEDLLRDMTAPSRYVFVDGVDAAVEQQEKGGTLSSIALSAKSEGACLVVSCRSLVADAVSDAVLAQVGQAKKWDLVGLTDAEVKELCQRVPQLARMAAREKTRQLLSRPIVADLLVRAGASDAPLTEAGVMRIVWSGLVRNKEASDRGNPEARDRAFRLLGEHFLGGPGYAPTPYLDSVAVHWLRSDGLLRSTAEGSWNSAPDFAHDELRDYAVAAVLTAPDIVDRLRASEVPRWTLPAARLACQQLLHANEGTTRRGVVRRLWTDFSALAREGYGGRWGDVPTEAIFREHYQHAALETIWELAGAEHEIALRSALRVARAQRTGAFVNLDAADPLATQLAERGFPNEIRKSVEEFIDEWLSSHLSARTPAGQQTRIQVGEALLREIEDKRIASDNPAARPSSSSFHDTTDSYLAKRNVAEVLLPRLASLGPDLDENAVELLRRLGSNRPDGLEAVVERSALGLAQYSPKLLADLTEAYYLDVGDADPWDMDHNYGVRPHRYLGLEHMHPAFYRGPFLHLCSTAFEDGVSCINRLLNHAARRRSKEVRRLWTRGDDAGGFSGGMGLVFQQLVDVDPTWNIVGGPRKYSGDLHVWEWHAGTGIGPDPCKSALQALDLVCTGRIRQGEAIDALLDKLLVGCENVAMIALAVRLLIRNIDRVGGLLDPFLAEPEIWHWEVWRTVHHFKNPVAKPKGPQDRDRTSWDMATASAYVVLKQALLPGDRDREESLRRIGQELSENGARFIDSAVATEESERRSAVVQSWASRLDGSKYRTRLVDGAVLLESEVPETVEAALRKQAEPLRRDSPIMTLWSKYRADVGQMENLWKMPDREAFRSEVREVRQWAESVTGEVENYAAEAAAFMAAKAIAMSNLEDIPVNAEDVAWAQHYLLSLVPSDKGKEWSVASGAWWSPSRFAALALPVVWKGCCGDVAGIEEGAGSAKVEGAIARLAMSPSSQTRLYLAVGMDWIVERPCSGKERCDHEDVVQVAMWMAQGRGQLNKVIGHETERITDVDRVCKSLDSMRPELTDTEVLGAVIRASGAAAVGAMCVREKATKLLRASSRSFVRGKRDGHSAIGKADEWLPLARAALWQVGRNTDELLEDLLSSLADHPVLLSEFLRAMRAVAEEAPELADVARLAWPKIMRHVFQLADDGRRPFGSHDADACALLDLFPSRQNWTGYMHREMRGQPESWIDLEAWRTEIGQWTEAAVGRAWCLDRLIWTLEQELAPAHQAEVGLAWVSTIVGAEGSAVLSRTDALPTWLRSVRSALGDDDLRTLWRDLVDRLILSGRQEVGDLAD